MDTGMNDKQFTLFLKLLYQNLQAIRKEENPQTKDRKIDELLYDIQQSIKLQNQEVKTKSPTNIRRGFYLL